MLFDHIGGPYDLVPFGPDQNHILRHRRMLLWDRSNFTLDVNEFDSAYVAAT